MSQLLTPYTLGPLHVKNRISALDLGLWSDRNQAELARGGAGDPRPLANTAGVRSRAN